MKKTYQRRQLAAIMFTDIVGYTTLMGNDEDRAFKLLRRNRELHKETIKKHHGSFLKEMGDGILSSFPTVSEAVYCSLELQQQLKEDKELSLRIGIHSGEVVFEGKDVFGDGVNIASRIADFAKSGHILVSETVYRELGNKKGINGKLLEKTLLKNVKNPLNIYWINDGAGIWKSEKDDRTGFSFRRELKRRNIPKVLIAYIAVSLVLLQLAKLFSSTSLSSLSFPPILYTILLIGLPCAILLGWVFEWSPNGFMRITSDSSLINPYRSSQRKPLTNNWILSTLLLLVLILYGFLEFYHSQSEVSRIQPINQNNYISPKYLSAFTTFGMLSVTPSWSPDGKYIAYASDLNGSMDIYVKPIDGKESMRLTYSKENETHPSWSSDSRTIIFSTESVNGSEISIINSEGGNPRQILPFGSNPIYSNDNKKFAFVYNNDIYTYDFNSRDTLKVAEGALKNPSMVWTKGDNYILFWSLNMMDIARIDLHERTIVPLNLIGTGEEVRSMGISRDGGTLIISKGAYADRMNLWLINFDTITNWHYGEPKLLNGISSTDDVNPSFSPDGKKIVYSKRNFERHLWKIEEGKENIEQLTTDGQLNYYPELTVDGNTLGFTSHRTGNGLIYKLDLNTGRVTRLSNDWERDLREIYVSFSIDTYPMYYSSTKGGTYQIWTMQKENSPPMRITKSTPPQKDICPRISPDGSKLIYNSNKSGNDDIWLYDLGSIKNIQLTNEDSNERFPTWSPDGGQIAYISDRNGSRDVWVMNSNGNNQKVLVSENSDESWCQWSPDGKWIYYSTDRSRVYNIWKVQVDGGSSVPITKYKSSSESLPEDGRYNRFTLNKDQIIFPLEERKSEIFIISE